MQFSILHLSDIHFKNAENPAFNLIDQIATSCFQSIRSSELFLIAITGDIAFSGTEEEYKIASEFLDRLIKKLKTESSCQIDVIVVAGNHDCILKPIDSERQKVLDRLDKDPSLATDDETVSICTSSQKHFFDFQKSWASSLPVFEHKLWTEYEYNIQNSIIRISTINAAWMSQLPEIQGKLIFPIQQFEANLNHPSHLRIAFIHHPLNWYEQNTYQLLKKALHGKANVVLSGHEHSIHSGVISDTATGQTLYFEAGALQPHHGTAPSFSLLEFDVVEMNVTVQNYQESNGLISPLGEPITNIISRYKTDSTLNAEIISTEFNDLLSEPGGNFSHPFKAKIQLDDIFIYPDVKNRKSTGNISITTSSEVLIGKITENPKMLFLGEEKAGKTTLLFKSFKELYGKGFIPLYIKASDVTQFSDKDLEKHFHELAKKQYQSPLGFDQSSKSRRVALVDNLDQMKTGPRFIDKLIDYLQVHFSHVVLTASTQFQITEMLTPKAAEALAKFDTYEILNFGHRLRLQLIQKWCQCGSLTNIEEYEKQVHRIESTLNTVVGKNFVPSQPLYLLILLQSSDQQQQSELQNSSFAYYYQYLITKSLKEAGIKPNEFNEIFNYLSNLAWFYSRSDVSEATRGQLIEFNKIYSEKYISVDLHSRLTNLTTAKILSKYGDTYSFTYPYIYYFFVGKYASDNLIKPEIKEIVLDWCSNFNNRANAHSVLFLTHHSSDPWVVNQISAILKQSFQDSLPMEFNGDTEVINGLIDSATQILIDEPNVPENQIQARRQQDEMEENDNDDSGSSEPTNGVPSSSELEFYNKINLMLRTAEILGQILKNYYGSMEREFKAELLNEVITGPLRFIRAIIQMMSNDPEAFIKAMESLIDKHLKDINLIERRAMARQLAFRVLGLVSTGALVRTAQNINTETLQEDVERYVAKNPNNANRLIQAATRLTQPGRIPIDMIRKLSKDLESNAFAFNILQSVGVFHIYMFHTDVDEKQQLCAYLKINMDNSRSVDLINSKTKLIK